VDHVLFGAAIPLHLAPRGKIRCVEAPVAWQHSLRGSSHPETIVNLFFGPGTDRPIRTAVDVFSYLPEDKKCQYRDGFSMAEAAKAWVAADGSLPSEIADIVGSDTLERAHFEYPTGVWGGGVAMTTSWHLFRMG
jgi:hypothetical protein